MKVIIAYSLLFSFFVLLTPRAVWHECGEHATEHHDKDHHHSSSEQTFEKDNCFACDFDLGIISQPSFIHFTFEKQVFVNKTYTAFSLFTKDKFQHFSRRGPPTA